jgi:nucleoside phosphorylase
LREFTAIGIVASGEVWRAEQGDFRPWRRNDFRIIAHEMGARAVLDAAALT